jgi:hypothetical protein
MIERDRRDPALKVVANGVPHRAAPYRAGR